MAIDLQKLQLKFDALFNDPNFVTDFEQWLEARNVSQNSGKPLVTCRACPNCKETVEVCGCIRNKCIRCGDAVGNITFTVCDKCWDIEHGR